MTHVTIQTEKNETRISMVGHSGYGEGGGDIVCAACSVLIQAMVNTMCALDVPVNWRQKPGEIHVAFENGNMQHRHVKAKGAYLTWKTGIEMLAGSYPENVKIEWKAG